MAADFYNKTLYEIVQKLFIIAGITDFLDTNINFQRIKDGTSISISADKGRPRYKDLEDFKYIRVSVVFNIIEDATEEYGYLKTPETEGFALWGYINGDLSDFSPDDFTHYAPGLNNGQGSDNFFRDHLDIPEAKESIARFKERVETL